MSMLFLRTSVFCIDASGLTTLKLTNSYRAQLIADRPNFSPKKVYDTQSVARCLARCLRCPGLQSGVPPAFRREAWRMFGLVHGCLEHALKKEELHVLILGLDKAGKTTLLEKIKEMHGIPGLEWDKILPTVGLNVGRIEAYHCLIIFWDLGGQVGLRSIWDKYYDEAHAVIYVVDSADAQRLQESAKALEGVLNHRDLVSAPLLVLANKQDLPESMDQTQVAGELKLGCVDTRECRVQSVSAHHGQGINEGLQWLVNAVKRSPRLNLLRNRLRNF